MLQPLINQSIIEINLKNTFRQEYNDEEEDDEYYEENEKEKEKLLIASLKENQTIRKINWNDNGSNINPNSIFIANQNIIDIGIENQVLHNSYNINNQWFNFQKSNFISIISILARL